MLFWKQVICDNTTKITINCSFTNIEMSASHFHDYRCSRAHTSGVRWTRGLRCHQASMTPVHPLQVTRQGCSHPGERWGDPRAITSHQNSCCLSLPGSLKCTTLSFENVIFIFTVFSGTHACSFIQHLTNISEHPACTRHCGLKYLVNQLSRRQEIKKDLD